MKKVCLMDVSKQIQKFVWQTLIEECYKECLPLTRPDFYECCVNATLLRRFSDGSYPYLEDLQKKLREKGIDVGLNRLKQLLKEHAKEVVIWLSSGEVDELIKILFDDRECVSDG